MVPIPSFFFFFLSSICEGSQINPLRGFPFAAPFAFQIPSRSFHDCEPHLKPKPFTEKQVYMLASKAEKINTNVLFSPPGEMQVDLSKVPFAVQAA